MLTVFKTNYIKLCNEHLDDSNYNCKLI